jgi:signal peptidase I
VYEAVPVNRPAPEQPRSGRHAFDETAPSSTYKPYRPTRDDSVWATDGPFQGEPEGWGPRGTPVTRAQRAAVRDAVAAGEGRALVRPPRAQATGTQAPTKAAPTKTAPPRVKTAAAVKTAPAPAKAAPAKAAPATQADRKRGMPLWQEIPLLLLVAFCMAVLIRSFLVQAFFIPSGSMEDTLLIGDRVLVNKVVYDLRAPRRGEIVVFKGPDNWVPENPVAPQGNLVSRISAGLGDLVGVSRPGEKDFIKRVIGLPGDRVSCCDSEGRVYVNGVPLDEPYVHQNSPLDIDADPRVCRSRSFDEILVPPGQLFVMGDHRLVSQDSRCEGPVPIDNVIGEAFVVVWPSDHWGGLSTPATFNNVPGPVAIGPPGTVRVPPPNLSGLPVTLPILATLEATVRSVRRRRAASRTLRT